MAIRDDLITQLTTNLASHTGFSVSSELPFEVGGNTLYLKNKKTVYLDKQDDDKIQLYRTLDQGEVYATETTVNGYMCVDAKNQPADIDTVIANVLIARNVITETQLNESSVESSIEDDILTYTFEYNITKLS
jgi:hypothetical protein